MSDTGKNQLFGQIAVDRGWADPEDVLEALDTQKRVEAAFGDHLYVGEILFIRGIIDEDQLADLVAEVEGEPPAPPDEEALPLIGEILVEEGLVTRTQILDALDQQAAERMAGRSRRVGDILVEREYVLPGDITGVLAGLEAEEERPEPPPEPGARPLTHCLEGRVLEEGLLVLDPEKTYEIGRSEERSIRLPSRKVSRSHARLYHSAADEAWIIHDVGSVNGTFVSGTRIRTPTPLADRDHILIKPFDLRFRTFRGSFPSSAPGDEASLTGRFTGDELVELVRVLARQGRDGYLWVRDISNEETGHLVLEDGRIVHARVGDDERPGPDGAAFDLLAAPFGSFELLRPAPAEVLERAWEEPLDAGELGRAVLRARDEGSDEEG